MCTLVCFLIGDMRYPIQWNAVYNWKFAFNFHFVKLFYLSSHLSCFRDLSADWSAHAEYARNTKRVGGTGLAFFVPVHLFYEINFRKYYSPFLSICVTLEDFISLAYL